jgi:hypothetical protein
LRNAGGVGEEHSYRDVGVYVCGLWLRDEVQGGGREVGSYGRVVSEEIGVNESGDCEGGDGFGDAASLVQSFGSVG